MFGELTKVITFYQIIYKKNQSYKDSSDCNDLRLSFELGGNVYQIG